MNGRLLQLKYGSESGRSANNSQTQLQPSISKDNALLPRISQRLGVLLQVKLTAHSDAKAKADPGCSEPTSAAEAADAAQRQASAPADVWLAHERSLQVLAGLLWDNWPTGKRVQNRSSMASRLHRCKLNWRRKSAVERVASE